MSDRSSRASAGSTSDSNERATGLCSSASGMSTGDGSSNGTGPESPASTMCVKLSHTQSNGSNVTDDHAPTLSETAGRLAVLTIDRNEDGTDYIGQGEAPTLRDPRHQSWICSAEASPAKTSPSPDDEQDSPANDPASSSSSLGSPTLFSDQAGLSSLRTFPDFFPPTVDGISQSFSRRWPSSGFTTSPGECWTADTSECPSGGGVSTSLGDVLVAACAPRFFLSPRAAAGILRRAEKRGRELPRALHGALVALASAHLGGDRRTTTTSSPEPSADATGRASTQASMTGSTPPRTAPDEEPRSPSPERSEEVTMGQAGDPSSIPTSSVRRLTPTECERLQGFPDGWTILPSRFDATQEASAKPHNTNFIVGEGGMTEAVPFDPKPDGPRYAACGDAITVNVAEWIGHRLMQHVMAGRAAA